MSCCQSSPLAGHIREQYMCSRRHLYMEIGELVGSGLQDWLALVHQCTSRRRDLRRSSRLMGRDAPPEPGDFDVYLLAQSWSPHFCCTNSDRCTTVPWAYSAKHLSLHGLWPGYMVARGGTTFPSSCKVKANLVAETMPREYIDLAPAFGKWNPEKHRAEVGDLGELCPDSAQPCH